MFLSKATGPIVYIFVFYHCLVGFYEFVKTDPRPMGHIVFLRVIYEKYFSSESTRH